MVQTLTGHGGTVTAVVRVGDYLISGSTDRNIFLWRAESGREAAFYPWFEHLVRYLNLLIRLVVCLIYLFRSGTRQARYSCYLGIGPYRNPVLLTRILVYQLYRWLRPKDYLL